MTSEPSSASTRGSEQQLAFKQHNEAFIRLCTLIHPHTLGFDLLGVRGDLYAVGDNNAPDASVGLWLVPLYDADLATPERWATGICHSTLVGVMEASAPYRLSVTLYNSQGESPDRWELVANAMPDWEHPWLTNNLMARIAVQVRQVQEFNSICEAIALTPRHPHYR